MSYPSFNIHSGFNISAVF